MSATPTDASRPPHSGQGSNLPGTSFHITGHDPSTSKSIVASTRPVPFVRFAPEISMGVIYTTTFPANLDADADIKSHDETLASKSLGLVKPGGTVCRTVDFAPNYTCPMHRTQSVDYGILVEGTIEMVLDDGSCTLMKRGDVAVQRATMHAWRNPSTTEWARMVFVLQECLQPEVAGKKLGEDLGQGVAGLPDSDKGGVDQDAETQEKNKL